MEKSSQRENILLGYSLQRSFTNHSSSPRSPNRDSDDVDFHDVFGGPPRRRSSAHETRYSFSETAGSFALKGGGDNAPPGRSSSWSCLNEIPVFGEDSPHGRRFSSNDFYDDIFKGDESATPPRRHELDIFSSVPGSRVSSPARQLPPPAEPFGSSSLPAELSLPSRLAKGTDLPALGSNNSSPLRNKVVVSNGSHTNASRFTLSRFSSSTSSHRFEDLKSDHNLLDRPGILSSEFQPLSSAEMPSFRKSDNASNRNSSTKGEDSVEDSNGGGQFQFHFSIYKWASKGVPLMMPLRGGNGSSLREKTLLRRSSSSTNRVVKEMNEKPDRSFEEKLSSAPSANLSRQSSRKDVDADNITQPAKLEKVSSEKAEKKMSSTTNEDRKHVAKSLSSFLLYSDGEQSEDGISEEFRQGDIAAKSDKKSANLSELTSSSKKLDKQTSLRNSKVKNPSFLSSDTESRQNIDRKKAGGRISEFVKIFNHEPASKSRDVVDLGNDSSTRKQESASKAQTQATVNKISKEEKSKLNHNTDASIKVDDVSKQSVHVHSIAASYTNSSTSSKEGSAAPNTVHVHNVSKSTVPDVEELFQENFSVKELPQDYEDSRESDNVREELQDIDTKIRQWSKGKEGNIRSLLSTLQYVLWPKSGWKPVPLVDIIEGNAVKRSYQKALLYLHPDKLQQKGASADQKYIAAKVFEILQEAWAHFNTLGGL
ncbi:J domain-containing protein required for chloroplast accumulation response 1-like [Cucurbita pepo subsp. pepo]|uniref:J domain-containing protein required for chloroplast accumulation response 1-like n=1 Tax=Cucurbita pepo subsp. pepo TaxID=3664 RepID=UPI000C9D59A8|nr:J domain-containing protein required for chloroplast accumulation response 1-like [Cucurbita pepo subsp. pepo]